MEKKPTPDELLDIIRAHCIDCCGGSKKDVRECTVMTCNLRDYRMGKQKYRAQPCEKAEKKKSQMTLFDFLERA